FFNEGHGNAAAVNAADDGYAIDDERRQDNLRFGHVELFDKIIRQPEQVEPPDAVGHELAKKERPGLAVAKELPPSQLPFVGGDIRDGNFLVALNVIEFGLGKPFLSAGRVV